MKYNLSEITEVIKNRRTIYPEMYSSRKVHREIIEDLLNNAIWAPTHGMTQPWRFTVFMEEGLERLSSFQSSLYADLFTGDQYNEMKFNKLKNRPLLASAVIAVSVVKDKRGKIPFIEEVEAASCAIQNMHLTATAYGLGAFWASPKLIGRPEMKTFLELEDEEECIALFYVGYPQLEEWPKGQRKPIEYLTKWVNE
ncbi:MAG: nitroreductase [Flavobacteriales bacterium]|jgi:nitroreductase|nr:nitroreductase [Flavobacteriales bacterium]